MTTPTKIRSYRLPEALAQACDKQITPGSFGTFTRAAVAAFIRKPRAVTLPNLGKMSEPKYKMRADKPTTRLWGKTAKRWTDKGSTNQLVTTALYLVLRPAPITGHAL